MSKHWVPRSQERPSPADLTQWADSLDISDFIANILWQRGFHSREEMQQYLAPMLQNLAPLCQWPGLEEAAGVICKAVIEEQQIVVWGDYDVDGVTGTAVIRHFLAMHGVETMYHLPNRMEEGYGLNTEWVEKLRAMGAQVLITVDCGITDFAPVRRARELGMTVVVTDHHLPAETLPDAHAICNPRLAECPCPALAGVGVAFFLCCALNVALAASGRTKVDVRPLLDLVALGTIADVVSLSGQNRILVKRGLEHIAEGSRPGIAALKEVSGYAPSASIGAGQVAFGLAPRINAAGRMGKADIAHTLLMTENYEEARRLAAELNGMNEERKTEEERIQHAAMEQAAGQEDQMGLVLYGEDWHSGVIGIVASRVVEAYYRPTLIICRDGMKLKGSGRSIREFNLHDGLCQCEDLLLGFGGHKLAAGLSLLPEQLEALRTRFNEIVIKAVGSKPLTASLTIDNTMGFDKASDFTLLKELELLQPFGIGNPEPVFSSPSLLVKSRRVFARKHVKLELLDPASGISLHAKAWRMVDEMPRSIEGQKIQLAYTPRIDRYNGSATVDLRIKDWKYV